MKGFVFVLGLCLFMLLPCDLAHAKQERLKPLCKSQYFSLFGSKDTDLSKLLTRINSNRLLRVDQIQVPKSNDIKGLLAKAMDVLFLETSDILRVQVTHFHAQVFFLNNQKAVNEAYSDLYHSGFQEKSFYHQPTNTIYMSYEDLTLERLGYEVAQAILSHYFVVSPSRNVKDVLAGYVQYNFHKFLTPSAENPRPKRGRAP